MQVYVRALGITRKYCQSIVYRVTVTRWIDGVEKRHSAQFKGTLKELNAYVEHLRTWNEPVEDSQDVSYGLS